MKQKLILILILVGVLGATAGAQIDTLSQALNAANANYLDIRRDLGSVHAVNLEQELGIAPTTVVPLTWQSMLNSAAPLLPSPPPGKETPATASSLWQERFSLQYGYTRNNSKLSDDATTNVNSVNPNLTLVSPGGFILSTGLTYAYSSKRDDAPSGTGTDAYSFTIQPSQEIFRFFPALRKFPKDTLSPGVAFGYGRSIAGTTALTGHTGSAANSFSISPNITYVRKFSDAFSMTLQPAYQMTWKATRPDGGIDNETNGGIFKLTGGASYSFNSHWILSTIAVWSHDTNQRVAAGQLVTLRDWGSFGGALEYDITTKMKMKVSYTYDAFRNDYDQHNVLASGEIDF